MSGQSSAACVHCGGRRCVSVWLLPPPAALSPNARVSRWERMKAARGYREAARVQALDVRNRRSTAYPLTPPVRVVVTFGLPDRRRRDWDNLIAALKPAFDGLVDARLLADDSVWELTPTYRAVVAAEPGVVVCLGGGAA